MSSATGLSALHDALTPFQDAQPLNSPPLSAIPFSVAPHSHTTIFSAFSPISATSSSLPLTSLQNKKLALRALHQHYNDLRRTGLELERERNGVDEGAAMEAFKSEDSIKDEELREKVDMMRMLLRSGEVFGDGDCDSDDELSA